MDVNVVIKTEVADEEEEKEKCDTFIPKQQIKEEEEENPTCSNLPPGTAVVKKEEEIIAVNRLTAEEINIDYSEPILPQLKIPTPIAPKPKPVKAKTTNKVDTGLRCSICNYPVTMKCGFVTHPADGGKVLLKQHLSDIHINVVGTYRESLHFFVTWVDLKGYVCPFCPQSTCRLDMEALCKHIHLSHGPAAKRIATQVAKVSCRIAAYNKFNAHINSYQCLLCSKENTNLGTLAKLEFHIIFNHRQEFIEMLLDLQPPMQMKNLDRDLDNCFVCGHKAANADGWKRHMCSVHLWCADPLAKVFNSFICSNGSSYSCPLDVCGYKSVGNRPDNMVTHIQKLHHTFAERVIYQVSVFHRHLRATFFRSTVEQSDSSLPLCPFQCSKNEFEQSCFCDPVLLMDIHLQGKHPKVFKSILIELKLDHLLKLKGIDDEEDKKVAEKLVIVEPEDIELQPLVNKELKKYYNHKFSVFVCIQCKARTHNVMEFEHHIKTLHPQIYNKIISVARMALRESQCKANAATKLRHSLSVQDMLPMLSGPSSQLFDKLLIEEIQRTFFNPKLNLFVCDHYKGKIENLDEFCEHVMVFHQNVLRRMVSAVRITCQYVQNATNKQKRPIVAFRCNTTKEPKRQRRMNDIDGIGMEAKETASEVLTLKTEIKEENDDGGVRAETFISEFD